MSDDQTMGARLDDLEIMVAHHARTIEELSGELARSFETIERLQRKLSTLSERFEALEDVATPRPEITKPPHY